MKLISFAVLFSIPNYSNAQSLSLTSDRPRQTISINNIPKKWLQIETGLGISINKKSFEKIIQYSHPSLSARYGLSDKIEMRVNTGFISRSYDFWTSTQSRSSKEYGSGPIEIGGKIHLLGEKKVRPAISVTAHYRFNNNLKLTSDTMNGGNFRFSFQNHFSDNFILDYSTGIDWISWQSQERYIYTISPVFIINEKWKGYLEAFGIIWKDISPLHFARAGASYSLTENMAIDLLAGKAWNKKESYRVETFPSGEIALQFSWRFKTNRR